MVRYYLDYLHFCTIFITAINIIITSATARIFIGSSLHPGNSPDLGCVRAQRVMALGRLLVQPTHLLPCGPRPMGVWLNLQLATTRCLNSEKQDTTDNNH